ncbi:hypothetical protein [Nocardia sp. NPDC005366]|uniref:hypothetical protein n=1 Tax=Nocardia sp. NPDC005366 TaxID=3156878 RepID=UPI0033BDD101
MATGVVVGALTLGPGTPHLIRGIGHVPWQVTIAVTSGLTVLAALGAVAAGWLADRVGRTAPRR